MAGLQVDFYVSVGITWLAALVALSLRMLAWRTTRMRWWLDHYFSILAFLFATGYCAILIEWTIHWSLGKRMPGSLNDTAREAILYQACKFRYFNSICYAASLACSKLSILLFYWGLFNFSTIRIPIILLVATITTHFILDVVILVLPIFPVFRLRLPLQQKLGVIGFFLLGTM
ncbi:hypothetical protein E8E11_005270 [Didymella keratinophila]|nr:hypothetical protein E8E11_005270 [Didymella keratinophila]